jgi:regulator of replication initiation timing
MNEDISTPTNGEGPSSLREALVEEFKKAAAEPEESAEDIVTDDIPTDNEDDAAALETSEQYEAEDESTEEESLDDESVIQAPEHWSDEYKEAFQELPRAAQDAWLKREKEYEQGISKKSEELKTIEEAFKPYDQMLQMRGMDRATAIRTWIAAQSALDTNPVEGLKMLIQTMGPEVQAALAAEYGLTGDGVGDDGLEIETAETRALKKQLEDQKRQNQQLSMQQQTLAQRQALAEVQQFKDEKDADGNLLRPHFDLVRDHMTALFKSGYCNDLQTAYDKAVWSLPEYRQEITEKEREAARKEEEAKRRKAAANAKKKAGNVKGSGSKPPPQSAPKTLRDDLLENYRASLRGEL